jgi:hypothetical protein
VKLLQWCLFFVLEPAAFFVVILPLTVMPHKKPHLPTKICAVCERPFTWRKKWEKVWEEVKYCSDRCRQNKHPLPPARKQS